LGGWKWLGNISSGGVETLGSRLVLGVGYYCYVVVVVAAVVSCLLSQAFSSLYFSETNGDPHRSGFNFQTAVLHVLRMILQIQLSFVVNIMKVFLVWLIIIIIIIHRPHFTAAQLVLKTVRLS